jgi:ABC-2 type transport system permease protein
LLRFNSGRGWNELVWKTFTLDRFLAIIRKEIIQIRRDPRTLGIMLLMPVVQLILFGYAATTNVEHLRTVVWDGDRTPESRELIRAYQASNYFDIVFYVEDEEAVIALLDNGDARAGMIILVGYGERLARRERPQVAFLIDGSDPSVANTALAAAQSVGQAKSVEIVQRVLGVNPATQPGVDVRPRVLYNPEMKSSNYMIPAIIGIIMQFLTTLLTALAIVRERERGTMEQLIVTPLTPLELILGKATPYVAVAFFDLGEVMVVGVFWFGMPIHGSITLLLGLSFLFLLTSLGLGLFVSAMARTQQEAMFMTMFMILPSIFLSGFFFPLEAMPAVLQALSYIIPLRYFLIIVRGIVLKGVGLSALTSEVVALCIFGPIILLLAAQRFTKRLQ